MARRDDDDETERFEEKPRPKKPRDEKTRDEGIQPAKPKSPKPADDDWDDTEDRDERPRRRDSRPRRRDDDGVSTIIPYKNGMALAGYYCGVFSLIPFLGALLGPLAVIFGIAGLRAVKRNPEAKGTGHSITAIVLGSIGALYNWVIVVLFVVGLLASGRR